MYIYKREFKNQMNNEKEWREKARKFVGRAIYTIGEPRRRIDKVKKDEGKAIYKAFGDLDGNAKMVAWIFRRSRRTISSVLAKAEAANLITGYKRLHEHEQESAQFKLLAEFISQWKSELPLPLNCLGNEYLSAKEAAIPFGIAIKWDFAPTGHVVRRFEIETTTEFKLMRKNMPHSKLWQCFKDYKLLCGRIIEACSILARDIRIRSEKETGLNIAETDELGLDQYFAWTIYADALNIFTEDWAANVYFYSGEKDDICQLCWGDYALAVVKQGDRAAVETVHLKLRAEYKESSEVRHIFELGAELHQKEGLVAGELDVILQGLVL